MNLVEVGKLLAIISSFDNRRLDESTAVAWKMMLDREVPSASLQDAQEVVLDWFASENPYFEVRHLVVGLKKRLRLFPGMIREDVRAAKARRLIGASYPDSEPLPHDVAKKLSAARLGGSEQGLGALGSARLKVLSEGAENE